MITRERVILGIDPGTSVMGYGIVLCKGQQMQLVQFGVIHLRKYDTHEYKLKKIFDRISELINEYLPDEIALEAPFYGKNVQSMLKLGRAQGVAMAAALSKNIPIQEYAPRKVKQAVTGNGNASKEQVAAMLQKQLGFEDLPKMLDATDALAVAVCHSYAISNPNLQTTKKTNSWKAFATDNPKRVK